MKYYIIAGERSGDLHGANLIRALSKADPGGHFRGFGGDEMKASGMELVWHYRELAFMGVLAVIAHLGKIRRALAECKSDIGRYRPDVIILIDYAGFNLRIARFAKEKDFKVYYYISPKVWAWNRSRAHMLKANVDRMFCILPFEKKFYKEYSWDVDYVGNPVLDAVKAFRRDPDFMQTNNITEPGTTIALLPGSRRAEVKRVLPLLRQVIVKNPNRRFMVAAVGTLPDELYNSVRELSNVSVLIDCTYDLLSVARCAIVTSGTATLETALFRVPQVVVYKTHPFEYTLGRLLVKVEFISLVNLIAGREVVKELLQDAATVEKVNRELQTISDDPKSRATILDGYEEVWERLDTGSASENAARLMVQYLRA